MLQGVTAGASGNAFTVTTISASGLYNQLSDLPSITAGDLTLGALVPAVPGVRIRAPRPVHLVRAQELRHDEHRARTPRPDHTEHGSGASVRLGHHGRRGGELRPQCRARSKASPRSSGSVSSL